MSQEEFFSFEQALDHLRLKEEELRRLVSEGEIRAFRDGETMKLRKRDVEELGRELMGGEVIDLSDADEDLVFEDDGDLLDPGMATEELTAADTLVEDLDELGTLELDAEDELEELEDLDDEDEQEELVAAAPAVDESMQPAAFLAILATTLVMLLCFPAMIAIGDGHTSDLAKGIGGVLYEYDSTGAAPAADTGSSDAGADDEAAAGDDESAGDSESAAEGAGEDGEGDGSDE
ncbi:MAG: MerR family transcriptional regulator [Planctomycetota bacterium]|jgi:excisionase family DNA binding protein